MLLRRNGSDVNATDIQHSTLSLILLMQLSSHMQDIDCSANSPVSALVTPGM